MKNFSIAAILAVSAMSANAGTELTVNGSFETGDLTGWTVEGEGNFVADSGDFNHNTVFFNGPIGTTAGISQNIATVAGRDYNFSFDVKSPFGVESPSGISFEAYFNGTKVYSSENTLFDWTHYTFTNLHATGALSEIKFIGRNDPSYNLLDNVSVTAVPEPQTYAMMLAGLALLSVTVKRRKA